MNTALRRSIPVAMGILLGLFGACDDERLTNTGTVRFPDEDAFVHLSEYNLFEDPLSALRPKAGVLPYDLNTALFSDYARKQRFVYVPKAKAIPYDTTGSLNFPVGTILVKNFSYILSTGKTRIIETRLLLRRPDGWSAEVYVWNDEQTEATRTIAGRKETIDFLKDGQTMTTQYQVPNKNQCKNCHAAGNRVIPIGPKIGNLNRMYDYESGPANQIAKWVAEGILIRPSAEHIPQWVSDADRSENLSLRARAYLEVNCAHCHSREGAASNTGLYLNYDNDDSVSFGFYKTPVAAGPGSGGLRYDIVPGQAAQSILYYRMNSREVNVRMPELGRALVDEEAVDLIREWINAMK